MKLFKPDNQILNFGLIALISLLIFQCRFDKSLKEEDYEAFLAKMYDLGRLNGNVLVLKNGNIVYQGAFGLSNINPIDSLNLNSQFRLASVSKQFTAMAIMQLQEKGKLSYNQDIREFIPELPYKGISIRHLLNHVSGLPDYTRLMDKYWKPRLKTDNPERFISGNSDIINMYVKKQPSVLFKPGEKFEYCDIGYVLLATIVSRISEKPFEQYLKEHIFEPAQMTNTSFYKYIPGIDKEMPLRVYGYQSGQNRTDLVLNDSHYLNAVQGDGGIYSTMRDLLKWDRILYTEKLISNKTREEAFSPAVLNNGEIVNYGFGWGIGKSPSGKKTVSHTGNWLGFKSLIYREIEEDNCIIILTNNSSPYFDNIQETLINILHDKP